MTIEENVAIELAPQTLSDEDKRLIDEDISHITGIEHSKEPVEEVKPKEEYEDDSDDHSDDTSDVSGGEDREAIRERRRIERQERKNRQREREESYKREIEALRRELSEVNTWRNSVESRNIRSGISQIDKAISDSNDAIRIARDAMIMATKENNGEALVEAQELYYTAKRRAEDLSKVRENVIGRMNRPERAPLDPSIMRNAESWTKDKPWYNPANPDIDTRVVLTIDNALADEGWDPKQPEYWEELDSRVKKYLPHRFANQQTQSYTARNKPPTEGSRSSSKASGNAVVLSPERVRAIKEAGAWDDPEERRKMVKYYIEHDRQQKGDR